MLISMNLISQIVEYPSFGFKRFCESPFAEIKQSGIGSLGFDNAISNYNPKFIKNHSKLTIRTSMISNIIASSHLKIDFYNYEESYVNSIKILPDFDIAYQFNNYLLQLNYNQTKLLNLEDEINDFRFNTTQYGFYNWGNRQDFISNQALQLSFVRGWNNVISLSIGIITNKFHYKLSGADSNDSFNLSLNFFEKYQIMSSLNLKFKTGLWLYFLIKNQNARIELSPKEFEIDLWSMENYNVVSYSGLNAFGIQFNVTHKLKVSLEILHQYIKEKKKITLNYYNTELYENNTSNLDLVLGVNHQINDRLQLGLMYQKYIKYDTDINIGDSEVLEDSIEDPQSLTISSLYGISNFLISVVYQYSYNRYYDSDYDDGSFKESSNFVRISLSTYLF